MNVVILNGSPKGMTSVTMQYMRYLELKFPENSYQYINAARQCTKFEKNTEAFNEAMDKVEAADLVLWAFPLYYLLVCSQYKRFIELIFERNRTGVFREKHAAALSTSIHFFDHTAMNYINAVCDDLGMYFLDGLTPKMDDLLDGNFRESFDRVFADWEDSVKTGKKTSKSYSKVNHAEFTYSPETGEKQNLTEADGEKICIVGALGEKDSSIRKMAAYAAGLTGAEVIDLNSLKFGPCIGCLKCGFDNVCAYDGKDGFIDLHRNKILKADIILFAGAIHDRYLSSVWQRYLERTFNYTHQPRLTGKQIGFLISGPLSQNYNIREILTAYVEVMDGNIAGIVTDEPADSQIISGQIRQLAERLSDWSAAAVIKPKSFLGEGGMKIFRDDIYSHLRFVFQADHKFYKKQGLYDFPQKKIKLRFITFAASLLTKIPPMRKIIREQLKSGMMTPYKKLFNKLSLS